MHKQQVLEKKMEKAKKFFDNSIFFDNKVKRKIEKKSNLKFDDLITWCCVQCYEKPRLVDYTGNIDYVEFFLFSIYRHRDILEKLWIKTSNINDKGFKLRLIDNPRQFKQYLWELYLKYYFIVKGLYLKRSIKNNGPDINIEVNSISIYLECIVPDQGNNDFKVPDIIMNGIGTVPIEQIKQRFIYAMCEKINKYKIYLEKGIVNKKDKLLIALNTSGLSNYGDLMDFKDPLLLNCCIEQNIFENNSFLAGIVYNHKSIFEYSDEFKIIIIKNNYDLIEDSIYI